jgi:hypothetical protein
MKEIEKMVPDDIDELIDDAKYKHLPKETLVSYRDSQLDPIQVALADAHLRRCLICKERLNFLMERAEVENRMGEAERTAIEQSIRRVKAEMDAPSPIFAGIQGLKTNLNSFLDAWMLLFAQEATLGTEDDEDVIRYESEDDALTVWARLNEDDASLEVYFSSPDLALEGSRVRFRLGPFQTEVTLEREEDSKVVAATIRIPRRERPKKMTDIEIEII